MVVSAEEWQRLQELESAESTAWWRRDAAERAASGEEPGYGEDGLQAAKWHQWKVHLFKQDDFYSTWVPNNMPILYNLEWDPLEEHQVNFPHSWVIHPIAAAADAFLRTLVVEP